MERAVGWGGRRSREHDQVLESEKLATLTMNVLEIKAKAFHNMRALGAIIVLSK